MTQHSTDTATNTTAHLGYSPQDLAEMYQFPQNLGEGQTVGILALGGKFNSEDLAQFCQLFNLPLPEVSIVGTIPSSNSIADLETNVDIQMVAGAVPKAKIVLYYADSFQDGFQMILDDQENNVNVVSTSWAIGEKYLSLIAKKQLKERSAQLNERNITLLASSGDNGIYEAGAAPSEEKIVGINLPAGLEHVTACGGTTLFRDQPEIVWQGTWEGFQVASGGSFSNETTAPTYQHAALEHYARLNPEYPIDKIATPDISANASKEHFSTVIFEGKQTQAWGTSAATPLLAGLIARLNHELGYSLGNLNEKLYPLMGSTAFNSDITGTNGNPSAPNWDPCTGLGSPNGMALLDLLKQHSS